MQHTDQSQCLPLGAITLSWDKKKKIATESGCLRHPRHQSWFPTNCSQYDNLAMSGQFQSHFLLALCHLLLLQTYRRPLMGLGWVLSTLKVEHTTHSKNLALL